MDKDTQNHEDNTAIQAMVDVNPALLILIEAFDLIEDE